MTEQYVNAKVKEAIEACAGDRHATQKMLVTQAVRDPTLLLGLVKPHLKAIVSTRIDHALRGPKKAEASSEKNFSKREIDAIIAARPMGEKRSPTKVPPPKASQRQATAIQQLVDAFKRKK